MEILEEEARRGAGNDREGDQRRGDMRGEGVEGRGDVTGEGVEGRGEVRRGGEREWKGEEREGLTWQTRCSW